MECKTAQSRDASSFIVIYVAVVPKQDLNDTCYLRRYVMAARFGRLAQVIASSEAQDKQVSRNVPACADGIVCTGDQAYMHADTASAKNGADNRCAALLTSVPLSGQ